MKVLLKALLLCTAMMIPKSPLVVLNFNFHIIHQPVLADELLR